MDSEYVRQRITELRMKMGVSEYKMSLDLGHSKSYVQSISSGRALPSLPEFLCICEYFGVAPRDFFDPGVAEPTLLGELGKTAADLDREELETPLAVARRLAKRADKNKPR